MRPFPYIHSQLRSTAFRDYDTRCKRSRAVTRVDVVAPDARYIQTWHFILPYSFPLPSHPPPSLPPSLTRTHTQALLGTIAALYAVATSCIPPPPLLPAAAADKASPPTGGGDGHDLGLNAGRGEGAGELGQCGQPTSRKDGDVGGVAPEQCAERQSRDHRNARPEPRTLDDHGDRRGTRATPLPLDGRRDSQSPSVSNDVHKFQQELHHRDSTTLLPRPVNFVSTRESNSAAAEDEMLRKRAERAERMLEVTRERLYRALKDGAANAAAATAAAAVTEANPTVDGKGGGRGGDGGRLAAASKESSDEEAKGSGDGGRRIRRRRGRGSAGEGLASPTTIRRSTPTSRGRSSSSGETEEVEERARQEDLRRSRRVVEEPWSSSGLSWRDRDQGHENKKYYSSDGATATTSAEQRRRGRQLGEAAGSEGRRAEQEHRGHHGQRRRRHSSMSARRAAPASRDDDGRFDEHATRRGGEGGGGGGGDCSGGEEEMRGSNAKKRLRPGRRRGRVVELRASDLARMREVVARLRIATFQLEAERAGRLDGAVPVSTEEGGRGRGRVPPAPVVAPGARGVAGEAEADALVRENTSLRRKLCGLVALEELEGRAVQKGLLPLTGGGEPGEEYFQCTADDVGGDQHT